MHHTFYRTSSILALVALVALAAFRFANNDDFVNEVLAKFQAYNLQRPVEKVYLHTDRDTYLTGETIWMKGYVFNGNTHTADTISKVLYVDLIDPTARRVRQRLQLRSSSSYAPGQLLLPDSLASGTYMVQAYTNYMRNFPETYYFRKTLTILKADGSTASTASKSASSDRLDVQFLPEGGQLVEGLESRVAFKALEASGRGLPVEGFVLNTRKDTITGLASTQLGVGFFTLNPEAGQTYTAFVKRLGSGQFTAYPLPDVQKEGVVMQVDNISNKDNIRVYLRHNKAITDPPATMTLFAQTRGQVVQVAKVPLAKRGALVQLPKAEFPQGIAQLTLFDETSKPICERLIFVNKNEQINITLSPNKTSYKNREKVELSISTTGSDGKPVAANLSLAAVDARLAPEIDSNSASIISHLLLSSDLTGTIEQPSYYFNPKNEDRWRQLDLLLMTQGWRRFVWADVLAGTIPPVKYPIEQGLSLTGRVVRPNQKDIGGKVKLTFVLSRRDSTRDFLTGDTDESGYFGAYDLDFTDTTTVLIQGVKGKANRDLAISLDQLLTPTVTITRVPYNPFEFRRDELAEFIKRTREYQEIEEQIRRNREVLLQSVTVKAKKFKERDSRVIYGTPDASVKFDQMNTAGRITILDVIQGRIAGVQVMGSGLGARVQIRGAANFGGAVEPLFVLDGMPVDMQTAINIPVNDVDQVDVLKGASASIYGSRGGGGVISILTKRGSPNYDLAKEAAPGTLVAKLPGYAPVRAFYSPRYDDQSKKTEQEKLNAARPDYRTTLFWSPLIQTNAEGKATVSFFTSDAKTNLRLRAEGATISGMPGMAQHRIQVD